MDPASAASATSAGAALGAAVADGSSAASAASAASASAASSVGAALGSAESSAAGSVADDGDGSAVVPGSADEPLSALLPAWGALASGADDRAGDVDGSPAPRVAHRLPCVATAMSRPVARPAGSFFGAWPSTGQPSCIAGANPTVTRSPGTNDSRSFAWAIASSKRIDGCASCVSSIAPASAGVKGRASAVTAPRPVATRRSPDGAGGRDGRRRQTRQQDRRAEQHGDSRADGGTEQASVGRAGRHVTALVRRGGAGREAHTGWRRPGRSPDGHRTVGTDPRDDYATKVPAPGRTGRRSRRSTDVGGGPGRSGPVGCVPAPSRAVRCGRSGSAAGGARDRRQWSGSARVELP